jgi:WD40 repeat protein
MTFMLAFPSISRFCRRRLGERKGPSNEEGIVRLLQNTFERPVLGVGFGPKGATVMAGGSGGFDVWDLATNTRRFVPTVQRRYIFAFVPDPLGRWLYFSAGFDSGALYDLTSGEARRFPGHDHHIISLAAAPDGSRVAISRGGARFNRLECWSVGTDGSLTLAWSTPALGEYTSFHGLAFHPAGHTIASVEERVARGPSGTASPLVLRNSSNGEQRSEFGSIAETLYLRMMFTAEGERLVTWDKEHLIIWEVATGTRVHQIRQPGRAHFNGLAVHPSGRFLATVAGDGQVRFWDARTLRQLRALHWNIGKPQSVAFSQDGMLAAAGGDKGQVVVWDVDD